jgi:hypothetical protein
MPTDYSPDAEIDQYDVDPLDDSAFWPGATEAEHAPDDLDETEV